MSLVGCMEPFVECTYLKRKFGEEFPGCPGPRDVCVPKLFPGLVFQGRHQNGGCKRIASFAGHKNCRDDLKQDPDRGRPPGVEEGRTG